MKNAKPFLVVMLCILVSTGCSMFNPKPSWQRVQKRYHNEPDMAVLTYVSETIRKNGAAYPELISVKDKPWLRLNVRMVLKLNELTKRKDAFSLAERNTVLLLLKIGEEFSTHERAGELDYLTEKQCQTLLLKPLDQPDKASLIAILQEAARRELQREIEIVSSIETAGELRKYVNDLAKARELFPDERNRTLRTIAFAPFRPFTTIWRKAFEKQDHHVNVPESPNVRFAFVPESCEISEDLDSSLIMRYAPIVLVCGEFAHSYPPDWDKIGRVVLLEKPNGDTRIWIDVSRPTLYAFVQKLDPFDQSESPPLQLTYSYWFPGHPSKKFLDFEAGEFEGAMFRVTLNAAREPMIYEYVLACGCHHGVYLDEELEQEAQAVYGEAEPGRTFVAEKNIKGRMPMVVNGIINKRPDGKIRPVLYHDVGTHAFKGMRIASANVVASDILHSEVRDYEEMEHQQGKTRVLSMFDDKGFVHEGERLESFVFNAFGMFKAGHPRQHVLQMINFDQAYLDDPKLYDTYLRIPPGVWHPDKPK
jgi:hypothetical protein